MQAVGRRFESGSSTTGELSRVELRISNSAVAGSSPAPTNDLSRRYTGASPYRKRSVRRFARRCTLGAARNGTPQRRCRRAHALEAGRRSCGTQWRQRQCRGCVERDRLPADSAPAPRHGVRGVSTFLFLLRREKAVRRASSRSKAIACRTSHHPSPPGVGLNTRQPIHRADHQADRTTRANKENFQCSGPRGS